MSDLHSIERAIDRMQTLQDEQNAQVNEKLDALIVQTTKTNGTVSWHSAAIYILGGAFLLTTGALLANGTIPISLFK